jgi:hypothetical protein
MSWVDVTTAVGTAGAAVVALGLGLRAEWRSIRTERQQREAEERRQAVHVAAWMLVERDDEDGPVEVGANDPSLDTRDMRDLRIYAIIHNASDEPIWDVVVNAPIFIEKSKGSAELRSASSEDEVVSVGPHETLKFPITALTIPYNRIPLKVEFRDNAGRDWSRDDRGRLHRGRSSDPSWAWFDQLVKEKNAQQKRTKKMDEL